MHVHSEATAGILKPPPGPGWRLEVNLERGKYRWVRRYGSKRQWTAYRPLAELPPERIAAARAESERQQALRGKLPVDNSPHERREVMQDRGHSNAGAHIMQADRGPGPGSDT